jgi:tripartite-type tricarboxylate transporter receptor subunit TctC
MAEAGVPGYDFTNWFGLVAPGNTPNAIVQKIYQDISTRFKAA